MIEVKFGDPDPLSGAINVDLRIVPSGLAYVSFLAWISLSDVILFWKVTGPANKDSFWFALPPRTVNLSVRTTSENVWITLFFFRNTWKR
mgnify:CR=1 FL=1